ncbi:fumarylacetoacetate hydrolase family protein [Georgenia sp. Z1491]|uniref:fumarylacetoacetate hydrolase family protein n=1 Tax=Georgenia sp. Z1491 TaxID=3416707 RepID=UPI003CEDD367
MVFALARLRSDGSARLALVVGERIRELPDDVVADLGGSLNAILADIGGATPRLEALAADDSAHWRTVDEVTLLAPVEPRQVIQAGANYRKHVIDLGVAHRDPADGRSEEEVRAETAAMMDERAATGIPYFFLGLPTVIAGPHEDLVLPAGNPTHDWELELAAVIGRPAFRVSVDEALNHVAGYTIVNDITTRNLVFRKDMDAIGTDWFRAKNQPGFLPAGPYLVPADQVGDTQTLRVTLRLNGEVMQDEGTDDMIFTVAQLLSHASQTTTLLPGDLLLTGSPSGNGAHWGRMLRPGDVMEGEITGLGRQVVRCRDEARA